MEFDLRSMTCSHCVNAVTKAVKAADPDAPGAGECALLARWSRHARTMSQLALCGLARRGTIYRADASNHHDDDVGLQAFDLSHAELRKKARKS